MDFKMKKYNKPVVEINGFEVEDIITASVWFSGEGEEKSALQSVYLNYAGAEANDSDAVAVFEW
jgi:hypothetical protein